MRSSSFLSTHLKVWGVFLSLTAVAMGIGGIAQGVANSNQSGGIQDQRHAQHFYAMIDGRIPTTGATVDVALATDIKSILGAHDGGRLPDTIMNFSGSSSSYGGVSDLIGFMPFNSRGQGCTECGPLSDQMLSALRQIKSGNDTALFAPIHASKSATTLTPFGMGVVALVLFYWLFVSLLLFVIARVLNPQGYAALNGRPGAAEFLLAPTYWGAQFGWTWKHYRLLDQKMRAQFPEQMTTIDTVNRLLGHVSGPRALEMRQTRDVVLGQLQSQILSGNTSSADIELTHSMAELTKCSDFLKARAEATKELNG